MARINESYLNLKQSYLFADIAKRVAAFRASHPEKNVISLGIGDVTRPLPQVCIDAMQKAVQEFADEATFRGYGPDRGYPFLREAIADGEYRSRGIDISPEEIFVSDGAKSDCGNIGDIFAQGNIVAISDPVYPVYLDTNIMAGRQVKLIDCSGRTSFAPEPPDFHADIVYLCSPNNPTGSALSRAQLQKWVDYARANEAILLYDSAYERFIREEGIPHSIYEIPGAKDCAIEFRSFSKTAGFTGVRCAYTIVPKALFARSDSSEKVSLHALWDRRQSTKFNGVSYIVQRGAAAIFTPEGRVQVDATIGYYLENAALILSGLREAGFECSGGVNAPYIWLKCPAGVGSWAFFDELLNRAAVVGTPGAGFGANGEGYFRLTAFGSRGATSEAVERIKKLMSI
ncbi:MAG: LL-diaminopimelate aminotransferase [Clostridia bacterium]|nr:LL-diaminopimelate aminotransferase [Clostridia bacterium]